MENVHEITVDEAKKVLEDAAAIENGVRDRVKAKIQAVLDEEKFMIFPMIQTGLTKEGEFAMTWDFGLTRKKDNAVQQEAS